MDKLRTFFKFLLIDTRFYEFAKKLYKTIKVRSDAKIFNKKFPDADYINYSAQELTKQKEQGYYSQYGQDYYLWVEYLNNYGEGVFIDIGANKPETNSNSCFLEKQGWQGIAIDPLKKFQSDWGEKRNATFMCGAVSNSNSKEIFVEILPKDGWEHTLSGFKRYVREEDLHIYEHREYSVDSKPLNEYLPNQTAIDLLLVDVEGAEQEVLNGIDFSVFTPSFILIENIGKFGGDDEIRIYLQNMGYECIARIAATDDLFIKKEEKKT